MINYTGTRNVIVKELAAYLGFPVVMLEQAAKKPPYPFVGYKITTTYNPEQGQSIEINETVPSVTSEYEYDIERTVTEQPTITISVTAYSKIEEESTELALQAREWFRFQGEDILDGLNIVVVETTPVQNRDILLVEAYERRQGFDVILRISDQSTKRIDTIEHAEITRKE